MYKINIFFYPSYFLLIKASEKKEEKKEEAPSMFNSPQQKETRLGG